MTGRAGGARGTAAGRQAAGSAGRAGFRHAAFLYGSEAEYLAGVSEFVRAALARGEPVLVAVPGHHAPPLHAELGEQAGQVMFADMAELGRNPGRVIPAMHAFARSHPGRQISVVGEVSWAARSEAEFREVAKHEALTNLAFADTPVSVLCAYDVAALPASVLAAAEQTHPLLAWPQGLRQSPCFLGAEGMPADCLQPLPPPAPHAESIGYRSDLSPVRALIGDLAARAGLSADRAADLVLAASELAANTLRHTSTPGTLRAWQAAGELICEVSDKGWIGDPLAGRHAHSGDDAGGHGLWLVNQVCDLVETRTGPDGTVIRLHMRLP